VGLPQLKRPLLENAVISRARASLPGRPGSQTSSSVRKTTDKKTLLFGTGRHNPCGKVPRRCFKKRVRA
jgi:hypothetical protein